MINLSATDTLRATAGTNTVVTSTVTGMELAAGVETYKIFDQRSLPNSNTTLYTVPASTQAFIKTIHLQNTSGSAVTVDFYINGSAAANRIHSINIPLNGSAIFNQEGWTVYDVNGSILFTSPTTLTGDVTGTGAGTIPTTIANDAVTFAKMQNIPTDSLVGRDTAGTGDPETILLNATLSMDGAGNLQRAALTGEVTASAGSNALVIANDAVIFARIQNIPTDSLIGRDTAGTGDPETILLNVTLSMDGAGNLQRAALTGDITASAGSNATVLVNTGPGATGPIGSSSVVPVITIDAKGRVTALTSANITPAAIGAVPTTRTITTTTPLKIDGGAGPTDLSADRTLSIIAATTSLAGSMSAIDKLKLDNVWIDVTANTIAQVLTTNTAAQNITAINAITAAAPNGSTLFFPHGRYDFNAAWSNTHNKMFTYLGEGSNRAGSPATAFTELRWTSNVGATLIVIPGSGNGWYTRFKNLTFTTTVDQTVGGLIDANGNVGIDFIECSAQSNGGFFNDVLIYGGGAGSNSANSTVVSDCHIQGFKGTGIRVNAAGSSLVVADSVIQGQWGTSAQMATAGISGGWVGALQINDCDILGCVNNLLLNPVLANSEVCASVFCTNTYFDFSLGSCFKITGTGATVRCRFDTCSFTTGTGATALSAVEINNTFAYAVGGMGIDFINCNVLNTFGTTGTTNGFITANTADYSISNCRIAGWTNGIQHTPNATVGRSQPEIFNNHIGTTGGFGVNTVGILLNAGTNGSLSIVGNTMTGNTTAITDNSTVTTTTNNNRIIKDNVGFNPKSVVAQPAVPASTVAVFNSTGVNCTVFVKAGTLTVISVGGVATGITVGSGATGIAYSIPVAANQQIAITFTVAPTWIWVGS